MNLLPSSSPSNILLLTTFLLVSYFPIYGHAKGTFRIIADKKGFHSDCAFDLGIYTFNLCPLVGTAISTTTQSSRDHLRRIENKEIDRVEGLSSGRRVYKVALGGMPTEGLRLPTSNLICDSDTWVCMKDGVFIETHGSAEPEPDFLSTNTPQWNLKARVIPIARKGRTNSHYGKILASIVIKDTESKEFSPLRLSLDGGEAEGHPQSAEIEMVCDFRVDSYLEFIDEHDGVHSFRWTTRHVCPTNVGTTYMHSSRLSTTDDESGTESGHDDELLPKEGVSTARRWMAIILVIVVLSVLCSSLFLASPRARHVAGETVQSLLHSLVPILSTIVVKLRPLGRFIWALTPQSFVCGVGKPFRQGSNQLVRWAEEDMTLRENDDMMVNDGGAYGRHDEESWHGVEFNEYIPLTASPKHGRGKDVKSYGATPDVETFEQRGMIGGIGRPFGR